MRRVALRSRSRHDSLAESQDEDLTALELAFMPTHRTEHVET
jgi:hypothetical protein